MSTRYKIGMRDGSGTFMPGQFLVRIVFRNRAVAWAKYSWGYYGSTSKRSPSGVASLCFSRTGHEFANGVARGTSVIQDCVHLLGNGHFHAILFGQPKGGVGRKHAFSYHAVHAGNDLLKPATVTQFAGHIAIKQEPSRTCEHQVAHAR